MNHRLFIALKISDVAKDKIISMLPNRDEVHQLKEHKGTPFVHQGRESFSKFGERNEEKKRIRWESRDKLHLTLKFIGEVDTKKKDEIESAIGYISEFEKYRFSFTEFDCFPNRIKPRILWVGMKINPDINWLVSKIDTDLEKIGLTKEAKRFNPHITLLRLKEGNAYPFLKDMYEIEIDKEEFLADEIALIESKLQPGGSVYKEIKCYKLK